MTRHWCGSETSKTFWELLPSPRDLKFLQSSESCVMMPIQRDSYIVQDCSLWSYDSVQPPFSHAIVAVGGATERVELGPGNTPAAEGQLWEHHKEDPLQDEEWRHPTSWLGVGLKEKKPSHFKVDCTFWSSEDIPTPALECRLPGPSLTLVHNFSSLLHGPASSLSLFPTGCHHKYGFP